ncbi:MAG: FAD-binding protein [Oscillospiraceae bacterium]|nr:FAD-binding protein [Oscillospiraceae bacterium]
MYDIAIIGLGPAGAVLARHLKSEFKVIAIDRKLKNENRGGFSKPCGGLLAPEAQKAISRLNMTLPKDILVSPQIFSVRTIDLQSGLSRDYQRFYINLDRDRLDRWLISQIPSGVEIVSGAYCTEVVRDGDGFLLTLNTSSEENGGCREIRARYVVGADGAGSVVRRSLFKEFKIRKYMSIQQHFADTHKAPFYSCIFDPSITDSYAWGLTKDDSFIFGGAFNLKNARKDFETLKEKLQAYGFKLEQPIKTEACLALRPSGFNNFCTGKDGAFLAGEAAGFISPSSLEGISYAINSGYILSACFNKLPAPEKRGEHAGLNAEYHRKTAEMRFKLSLKTLKRPFMYNPPLRSVIMKTGVFSLEVIENSDKK